LPPVAKIASSGVRVPAATRKLMIQEFKEFINKGNLVEIAVAFVMGLAFAAVVTSLTEDIVNPLIARVFSVESLADWAPGGIGLGSFLVAVINFLIVGLVMFLVVKAYNRMKAETETPGPSEEVVLLTEIRDNTAR
jgi:large conductance mechanosensitive channel